MAKKLTDGEVAMMKRTLGVVRLEQNGQAFEGEPVSGTFVVRRAERTADVRSGAEIVGVLKRLYPEASFEWQE
jgi:hypothetical protein